MPAREPDDLPFSAQRCIRTNPATRRPTQTCGNNTTSRTNTHRSQGDNAHHRLNLRNPLLHGNQARINKLPHQSIKIIGQLRGLNVKMQQKFSACALETGVGLQLLPKTHPDFIESKVAGAGEVKDDPFAPNILEQRILRQFDTTIEHWCRSFRDRIVYTASYALGWHAGIAWHILRPRNLSRQYFVTLYEAIKALHSSERPWSWHPHVP